MFVALAQDKNQGSVDHNYDQQQKNYQHMFDWKYFKKNPAVWKDLFVTETKWLQCASIIKKSMST